MVEVVVGLTDQASDWWVANLYNVGAGVGIAGGIYTFDFYSDAARVWARFTLNGLGSGLGGNASGWTLPGIVDPWTQITVKRPFSVFDLDMSAGTLWTLGVGAGAGFSVMRISAYSPLAWFEEQDVGGFAGTLGASAIVLAGRWHWKKLVTSDTDTTIA